ncbi:hypothetical protein GCM10023063_00630 [Arthrobacter methylotrophus]|uniref:hypothetical protein n=1 Tax=Arthrobacter methylotrophus TaxID=121291 RepID=UPI0031E664ED
MNLWFGTVPVFLIAATGAILLLRRWRKPAFKILAALNIAVMAGSLALLAGALTAAPAAASGEWLQRLPRQPPIRHPGPAAPR